MKINIWAAMGIDSDKAKNSINVRKTIEGEMEPEAEVPVEEGSAEETIERVSETEDSVEEVLVQEPVEEEMDEDPAGEATQDPQEEIRPEPEDEQAGSEEAVEGASEDKMLSEETGSVAEEQENEEQPSVAEEDDADLQEIAVDEVEATEQESDSQRSTEGSESVSGDMEAAETGSEDATEEKSVAEPEQEEAVGSEDESMPEEPTSEGPAEAEPAPEEPLQQDPKPELKERFAAFWKLYGSLAGIGAAFVILVAVMVIYTSMIPREINATINGEPYSFTTKAYTVERFLKDEKIEFCEEDYSSMPLTTFVYDGMKLKIIHATDFQVTADGKTKKFKSLKNTVGTALEDVGVEVGDIDIVIPAADTFLTENLAVVVQRVVVKEETKEEVVKFKTEKKDDASLNEGTTKVVTEGKNGKDKVTYEVTYIDGKESSRKEIDRETITKPVNEVIANGTRIHYNGQTYSRRLTVKAYAYTGGGTTAMGTRARVGEIAVDPSVIPLGTNVYIEGVGPRRAEDTGGNIQGNTIDIYMNTQAECLNWGVRYVTIYIE